MRFYARGTLDEDRIEQLGRLRMVWSHFDVAMEEDWPPLVGGPPNTSISWHH